MANDTTTFVQEISGTRFKITVPMKRVDRIIDRVDAYIDAGKPDRAFTVIQPFLDNKDAVASTAPTQKKVSNLDIVLQVIGQYGRKEGSKVLRAAYGMTSAQVYYYLRKIG